MEPPIPANKELYNKVKKMANKKFTSPSGIYRSSWIVNTYKKMGGRYRGSKPKNSGLKRWYKEKWIDLNSKSGKIIGYQNFFKKSSTKTKSLKSKNKSKKFPFCRPYLNSKTPRTIKEISKKSLTKAKRLKSKIKNRGNVQIGRGKDFDERSHLEKLKKEYQELLKDTNLPEYTRVSHQNRINIIQEILTDATNNSDLLKKYKKLITKKYISRPGIKEKRKEYKKEYRKKKIAVESLLNLKTQNFQSGSGKPQFKGSKSKIMVQVPKNVKKWAEYAFKLKKIGFKGAKETGWKRAKQLASKTEIPIEDLRYMRNWFARHIITSYPTFKKWQKAGRPKDSSWFNKRGIISWITWAGDAGFKWVNSQKNINLLNKHFNKSYKALFRKKSAKIRSSF